MAKWAIGEEVVIPSFGEGNVGQLGEIVGIEPGMMYRVLVKSSGFYSQYSQVLLKKDEFYNFQKDDLVIIFGWNDLYRVNDIKYATKQAEVSRLSGETYMLVSLSSLTHYRAGTPETRTERKAKHIELVMNENEPIPMRLHCPECGTLHIDEGEFTTKPHHTHACQNCGMVWRPAIVNTVGVEFLPGFKNDEITDKKVSRLYKLEILTFDNAFSENGWRFEGLYHSSNKALERARQASKGDKYRITYNDNGEIFCTGVIGLNEP